MDAKKWMVFLCLIGIALTVPAQSLEGNCNPFVAQGTIGPAPIPPVEFNGKGIISFKVGNTGDDDLVWEQDNPGNELVVTVRLSRGVPDVDPLTPESALTVIGGNYSTMFSWSYNMEENFFTGRQVQTIPGRGVDFVTIGYRVTQNSEQPENGFLVTLTPPAYTTVSNTQNDDQVSSYTWTELRDYGDAPVSYGLAYHKIQENPDFRIYLGSRVQGEILAVNTAAGAQDGDDFLVVRSSAEANTDADDDGVIIPDLYRGTTATISVFASGQGYLNGWMDWNGDGDFLDAGEQIAVNQLVSTTTTTISVAVPVGTPAEMVTYARFRFGPKNLTPTGGSTFGEVEDYLVRIMEALPSVAGTVFLDDDLLLDELVDGTGTSVNGKLFVNLINQGMSVVATAAVSSDGTFLFTNVREGDYRIQLTINQGVEGDGMPATKLPSGHRYAGEFLGDGMGSDGSPDGLLQLSVAAAGDITQARFGIVRLPDLTVNLTASINVMGGATPFCIYLKISELNMVNTTGTIRVIMPKDSRWTIDGDFDTSLTLLENFTLNNPDWSLDLSNDNYYIFSTDASISAGEFHMVGFRAMYNPGHAKGVYSITSQIVPGSGGDFSGSNNSDSEKIDYFNK